MKPNLWKNLYRQRGQHNKNLTVFETKEITKVEDLEMWYYMSTILKVTTIKYNYSGSNNSPRIVNRKYEYPGSSQERYHPTTIPVILALNLDPSKFRSF